MKNSIGKKLSGIVLFLLVCSTAMAQFEEGIPEPCIMMASCDQTPYTPLPLTYSNKGDGAPTIRNIVRFKFDELAHAGDPTTPYLYTPSAFTAVATLSIQLWALADGSGTPVTS